MPRFARLALAAALAGLVIALAGCAGKQATAPDTSRPTRTVRTMLTGLDQFPEESVLALSTSHGTFVVGPEVPEANRSQLFAQLSEARNQVLTITYRDMPATRTTVPHKRVVGLALDGRAVDLGR